MTRDTVPAETPASAAISRMVVGGSSADIGPLKLKLLNRLREWVLRVMITQPV
jgi:hypothetical protein